MNVSPYKHVALAVNEVIIEKIHKEAMRRSMQAVTSTLRRDTVFQSEALYSPANLGWCLISRSLSPELEWGILKDRS